VHKLSKLQAQYFQRLFASVSNVGHGKSNDVGDVIYKVLGKDWKISCVRELHILTHMGTIVLKNKEFEIRDMINKR
jgi:hypothetical protein